MSQLSIEERIALIKEVGEEIIGENELPKLLQSEKELIAYDGFEPSGQMHITQGILRAININKMIEAGCTFKMLVADWHAFLNNKMGADLEKIQTVGKYFIEIWRACGMNLDKVEFIWASDHVKTEGYWDLVMRVAQTTNLKRILRTVQIMGRKETDILKASQILYPCMQTADIFTLGAQIVQLGMDQRKVNMLAREIGEELGFWKPVVVSHAMLLGLGKPISKEKDPIERSIEKKMSKSKPETCIFMTDTTEDVERKINKAFCPEGQVEDNPILEYSKYIIFEKFDSIKVERPAKWGGDMEFKSYQELEKAFVSKELHPQDLKKAVAKKIDELLEPVRQHFATDPKAKKLLEQVKSFEVTR